MSIATIARQKIICTNEGGNLVPCNYIETYIVQTAEGLVLLMHMNSGINLEASVRLHRVDGPIFDGTLDDMLTPTLYFKGATEPNPEIAAYLRFSSIGRKKNKRQHKYLGIPWNPEKKSGATPYMFNCTSREHNPLLMELRKIDT